MGFLGVFPGRRFASAFFVVACASHHATVLAWGAQGHRIVAGIAQARLTPAARVAVDALLAQEPGATLASVANWADTARESATAPWHYLNLPRDAGCQYVAARDCPQGQCVVAAIEAQGRRLATAKAPAERLQALKYLVHFVADLHQPLHVGYADDRGANAWQLQAFGRGTNLHALWDSGLLREQGRSDDELVAALTAQPSSARVGSALAPWEWARESCQIVAGAGFYPGRHLPAGYAARYTPVLLGRLQVAGSRLADALDRALVPTR